MLLINPRANFIVGIHFHPERLELDGNCFGLLNAIRIESVDIVRSASTDELGEIATPVRVSLMTRRMTVAITTSFGQDGINQVCAF